MAGGNGKAEGNSIFKRLRGPLTRVRQHRMCRIPEEGDRPVSPVLDRIAIEQLVEAQVARLGGSNDCAKPVIQQ